MGSTERKREDEPAGMLTSPVPVVIQLKGEQKDIATETLDLDREIGFDGAGFGRVLEHEDDYEMLEPEEESQFSISKSMRTSSTSVIINEEQVRYSVR